MLVAQCSVLSPDAQTHETFRCSYTQIMDADERLRSIFQTGSLAGRVLKAHMLAQNFFKGSAVLDYLLQSEIRKIDQGKGQKVF